MYITKSLAQTMEYCIKQTHIEVSNQYPGGKVLEVNGGAACFSGFDSYLSQVVGWGFNSAKKQYQAELLNIEAFYKSLHRSRIDIELCPYAGNDLATFLSQRGYRLSELNNVSALDLDRFQCLDSSGPFNIRIILPEEFNKWANTVAEGFGYPEASEQFTHYAKAQGVVVFGAFTPEGQLVAGATIALHTDVCDLAVTSTLPDYRSMGLQKMLLAVRLNYAKDQGMRMATVTTEPGSLSDLNVQKMGFRCAYTRIKMTHTGFLGQVK